MFCDFIIIIVNIIFIISSLRLKYFMGEDVIVVLAIIALSLTIIIMLLIIAKKVKDHRKEETREKSITYQKKNEN